MEASASPQDTPPAQDVSDILRRDAEQLELKEQRRVFLVDQHIANAKCLRDNLRL